MSSEASLLEKKTEKVLGIDLGTTNSVVAILEGATPVVIPNSEGQRTTPSIIAFTPKSETFVGQLAKRQSVLNPENTFYSIKRFIGCNYEEVKKEINFFPYKAFKDSTGKIKFTSSILKRDFSPEELSAIVLKSLVEDANRFLHQNINKAVITVPAYFNDSQRLATKDAGKIAGLDVLRIINEPTAAALAYGLDKKKNEIVLIFDLGGGTFDVSILEVGEDIFEVLSTSGNTHLGGNDFDNLIAEYVLQKFAQEYKTDLRTNKQTLQRVIEASEKAKIELSVLEFTKIDIPFAATIQGKSIDINYPFTRAEFVKLSEPILEKCKKPVIAALENAKLSKFDIDEVVIVGGSTRIPAVKNLLKNLIGKELNESVNPDEVVALGAAIQGGILAGEITDLILLDVTPLSLGVLTIGELMTKVIPRNSSVPIRKSESFSTAKDFQEEVIINVLQGERELASDNKSLGLFKLTNLPRAPRGVPQIEVTFRLDANGLLSVTARDDKSGLEQSISIEGASVLDRDQVEKLLAEAAENSEYDQVNKAFAEITTELDFFYLDYEKLLNSDTLPLFINKESTTYLCFCMTAESIKTAYNQGEFTKMEKRYQETQDLFACLLEEWAQNYDLNATDEEEEDLSDENGWRIISEIDLTKKRPPFIDKDSIATENDSSTEPLIDL